MKSICSLSSGLQPCQSDVSKAILREGLHLQGKWSLQFAVASSATFSSGIDDCETPAYSSLNGVFSLLEGFSLTVLFWPNCQYSVLVGRYHLRRCQAVVKLTLSEGVKQCHPYKVLLRLVLLSFHFGSLNVLSFPVKILRDDCFGFVVSRFGPRRSLLPMIRDIYVLKCLYRKL